MEIPEETFTRAPGLTTITTRHRDRRTITERFRDDKWTRETRSFSYGTDGCRTEIAVTESSDHPAVTNSIAHHDFLGRVIATLTPAFGGGWLIASNHYDGASDRLLRATRGGAPDTLHQYDALGDLAATALDLDGNGAIDPAGPDRITASATRYEQDASNIWWRVTASISYPETDSAAPFTNTLARTRVSGLGATWDSLPMYDATLGIPEDARLTAQTESFTAS